LDAGQGWLVVKPSEDAIFIPRRPDVAGNLPQVYEDRIAAISDEELEFRGWTREGMREKYLDRMERDRHSPKVGEVAPDFELELLSPTGQRTDERLSLSSLRGKPVGLIFGSFT
jgi:hypothetical protein